MRVTQRDIARLADVSQATVSRVLAGDARVEEVIRSRVMRVMREQNYKPDVRARALRSKRAGLIGLVINRPEGGIGDDPFFAHLIGSILDKLSGTPYHLCIDHVAEGTSHKAIYDEMLRTRRVDGLILVESEARDERIVKLQEDNFPFVLIGNPGDFSGILSVDNDNVFAAELATRHLIEQGYRRIAMLAGPRGVTVSEDRICGYVAAAQDSETPVNVIHAGFGLETAYNYALEALSQPNRPDAFVVLDDYMAIGVVMAARQLKISIPDQLGIVSFNDTAYCNFTEGGLSSVSLNISRIVGEAVRRLLGTIENKATFREKRMIIPVELKERGSSTRTGRSQ